MEKKLSKMPYAQAKVIIMNDGAIVLRSYYTDVALIQADGWLSINGLYSATTRKHIGAFMREYANSNYQLAKMLYENKMIYKAIKMLEINDFRAILQRLDKTSINDCYDAIIAEKNASIIKLQDNRKRIFQKSTFLQNDEFLSNEYSTAVTYEMIINEYLRKS